MKQEDIHKDTAYQYKETDSMGSTYNDLTGRA